MKQKYAAMVLGLAMSMAVLSVSAEEAATTEVTEVSSEAETDHKTEEQKTIVGKIGKISESNITIFPAAEEDAEIAAADDAENAEAATAEVTENTEAVDADDTENAEAADTDDTENTEAVTVEAAGNAEDTASDAAVDAASASEEAAELLSKMEFKEEGTLYQTTAPSHGRPIQY